MKINLTITRIAPVMPTVSRAVECYMGYRDGIIMYHYPPGTFLFRMQQPCAGIIITRFASFIGVSGSSSAENCYFYAMALLRFRIYWEEDDQVYRDIEIQPGQTFLDLHQAIIKAYEFDGKHAASFYESNDRWEHGRAISSEVLVNKKDAPALSMLKTPVSALVTNPGQKFIYEYDPAKRWLFLVELIGVSREENPKLTYPHCIRKEGIGPAQYGVKGVHPDKLMEVEEKYDLGADEMAEGFGSEGEEPAGGDDQDTFL